MSAAISTQSHGDVSATLDDSFLALLQDVDPYIDDILTKPAFHHFLDLPVELRCKVYDQYFLDNTDSVACKTWPTLLIDRFSCLPHQGRKTRRAFLPKLCLVNKALQEEQLGCLTSPMHLDCECILHLATGMRLLEESLKDHNLLGSVRDVSIRRTNDCYKRVISNGYGLDASESFIIKHWRLLQMQGICSVLLSFPRLRQLTFALHAPLRFMGSVPNASNLECVRALPIDSYIEGFNIHALLAMKELTKITIIGSAGSDNCPEEYLVPARAAIEEDGKVENLQAVKVLARKIKDDFKNQGQDVLVEVYLRYSEDKAEEIVME